MKAISEWCHCNEWRQFYCCLKNRSKMNFCVFCGAKLVKQAKQNKRRAGK